MQELANNVLNFTIPALLLIVLIGFSGGIVHSVIDMCGKKPGLGFWFNSTMIVVGLLCLLTMLTFGVTFVCNEQILPYYSMVCGD